MLTLRIILVSFAILVTGAFAARLAHAGTPPEAAVSAAIPAAVPDDCALADAEVTNLLRPAMTDSRHLPAGLTLGDALASLYKARTLCKQGAASQGMMVYIRLSDALGDRTGIKRR
ncbi:MAG TPA: hypothetical protein VMQ11_03505 [Alphaproteobacteria bacterium]|nr:hypothetical protein [Alphaproteobacteria bacterium]